MAGDTLTIGGREFIAPVLEGLLIDAWLARVELLVGETAAPHSEKEPKRVRISFDGVIEFRGYREPVPADRGKFWQPDEPYQLEEIEDFGEAEALSDVERVDEGTFRLVNPSFRNPVQLGFTWIAHASKPPRLVWLATWCSYLEFLYGGRVSHEELGASDALEEWRLQRVRLQRGEEL